MLAVWQYHNINKSCTRASIWLQCQDND